MFDNSKGIKIDICQYLTYIDAQGDFWYYIDTTENKHNFRCAYLLDDGVMSVVYGLTIISETVAKDDATDGCQFSSLGNYQ